MGAAAAAGKNILNWTKRQQLGIDPPPEEGGEASKTEEAAPAPAAPTVATSPAAAGRTKARQGTQAVKKGQEPRPPLRGDTLARMNRPVKTLVRQAPLYTPDEGITPDLKQYAKQEWDPLGRVVGRPLGAQYYGFQGGKERMSEAMPGAHARRVAKHTVYGPDGELVGHSLPPDELDPLVGVGGAGADKPIGGYTIGDQKPQEWRSERYTSPAAVAARLMDPHPPRGEGGDSILEDEGAIEEAFGMIDPLEFNVDESLVGSRDARNRLREFPGPSLWTIDELSQHLDYLSIPVLRQYQRYLVRNLGAIERARTKLADHAAEVDRRRYRDRTEPARLRELHRRRFATLEKREAGIKDHQAEAQRLLIIMKAMARRAGVTDEELK